MEKQRQETLEIKREQVIAAIKVARDLYTNYKGSESWNELIAKTITQKTDAA